MPFPARPMTSTGSPARPGQVSNSGAQPFRAKKKKPVEVNPTPNNAGRQTGPPMQKGHGAGSMFADGRPQGNMPPTPNYPQGGPGRMSVSGQPQSSLPPRTPSYPMMGPGRQGGNGQPQGRPPMMADGGFGSPAPIGGAPPPDADQDAAPDMDDSQGPAAAGEMPAVRPEAVNYHDEAQNCGMCQHMDQNGMCNILQMQVSPDGGCAAFEPQAMDQGDTGAGFGGGQAGGPMSDSGNPPQA